MQQLNAQQVQQHLRTSDPTPTLVDVREPHETRVCHIDGAINIPLSRFAEALNKLDPSEEIVLFCHHGMRSMQAGMFLKGHGYHKLINMQGGINAWACDVDPQMARY